MTIEIKSTDYYRELNNRVSETIQYGISNCIGSAEYFTQEKDIDEFSEVKWGGNFLEKMTVSVKPIVGGIVRWKSSNNETYHAGIIVDDEEELKITHRDKKDGAIFRFIDIRGVAEDKLNWLKREYLIPTKLKEILDSEVQN